MTLKQAAQKSIDDRWLPISQAESVEEMDEIFDRTRCAMCEYQGNPVGYWGKCRECLLNDRLIHHVCCKEFCAWWNAVYIQKDFPAAQASANAMVERLRKIVEES
jgi:hypothetical protein